MPTKEILDRLCALDEAPWSELKGSPLDSRRLAHLLSDYEVKSKNVRASSDAIVKGYTAEDLYDPWTRYLPVTPVADVAAPWETEADLPREVPLSTVDTRRSLSYTSATSATSVTCPSCDGEGCPWCR